MSITTRDFSGISGNQELDLIVWNKLYLTDVDKNDLIKDYLLSKTNITDITDIPDESIESITSLPVISVKITTKDDVNDVRPNEQKN